MNLQPLNDMILVRVDEPETKAGLVHLPDSAKTPANTGTVLAVGPGKVNPQGVRVPVGVAVGDRVLFRAYGVEPVADTEADKLLMTEDKVIAKVVVAYKSVDEFLEARTLYPQQPGEEYDGVLADGTPVRVKKGVAYLRDQPGQSTWEHDAAAAQVEPAPKAPELGVLQPAQNNPTANHPLSPVSNLDASLERYTRDIEARTKR